MGHPNHNVRDTLHVEANRFEARAHTHAHTFTLLAYIRGGTAYEVLETRNERLAALQAKAHKMLAEIFCTAQEMLHDPVPKIALRNRVYPRETFRSGPQRRVAREYAAALRR